MEKLLLLMSICCFISNFCGLIANLTGINVFGVFILKTIFLFGVLFPVLYRLKLLNII